MPPPATAPRELGAFLAHSALVRRHPIRLRRATAVRVVRMRWDTPRIDDLAALADFLDVDGDHLDWYADRRHLNRHARDERLRHYPATPGSPTGSSRRRSPACGPCSAGSSTTSSGAFRSTPARTGSSPAAACTPSPRPTRGNDSSSAST
ncbi:hypothetical protein AB0M36_29930 [Actinoplanes sp. NPDC051346]|uniref:hypothetical protein n=1 Tax=Actinoplanes sp. NPDC051346 TaxID=3155048 RepID=UPI003441A229